MIKDLRAEVEERNSLRKDAALPLLSVVSEVRRIYQARQTAKREADFEHFVQSSPLRAVIENELLMRERLVRNDPNWTPMGMLSGGGWAFHTEVRNRLRQLYTDKSRD